MSNGYDSDEPAPPVELESWVRIQSNTFANWINNKLRILDLEMEDPIEDFRDGILLCRLVEVLQGKGIGRVISKKNVNHYEASGNLALALEAMKKDDVRLVNIGAEDIAGGNTKLILGMIWTLIRRYQIGSQSRLPPKKLMLSWVNAVLHPHRQLSNFDSDWTDGVALHGVIEYCHPGFCPSWWSLSPSDSLSNCREAMQGAEELLEVPQVVSPENFSSRDLDELSGMTYLSYFMAEGAPGYNTTMQWTNTHIAVSNFDKDWNNGYILSGLVQSLGGEIPGWPNIDTSEWNQTIQTAMDEGKRAFNVEPIITAKDMMNPEIDHIAVMAYAAWLQSKSREPSPSPPRVSTPPPVVPAPSDGVADLAVDIVPFWRVSSTTTIKVNTSGEGSKDIRAVAKSPSGTTQDLPSSRLDHHNHHVPFTPDITGHWQISFFYDDREGEPFSVQVYDPAQVTITRDEATAKLGERYSFRVNCANTGLSDISAYIIRSGESVEHDIEEIGADEYRVSFVPDELGLYNAAIFCGGVAVPASPFDVRSEEKNKGVALSVSVQGEREVTVRGQGIREAFAKRKASFVVETGNESPDQKDFECQITDPNECILSPDIIKMESGEIAVTYLPEITGQYTISLHYDGKEIPGSPFNVTAKSTKVMVQYFEDIAYIHEPFTFNIDASQVEKGQLEIDSDLPVRNYDRIGTNIYKVTIIPKKLGRHDLVIKYNEEVVEGGPFEVDVRAPNE